LNQSLNGIGAEPAKLNQALRAEIGAAVGSGFARRNGTGPNHRIARKGKCVLFRFLASFDSRFQ